jgi:hypothetical protein
VLDQPRPDGAGRTAGVHPRDDGGVVRRLRDEPLVGRGRPGLVRGEKGRPELDALGAERQRSGDAAPVHQAAGKNDGHLDAVDELGHERDTADETLLERSEERAAVAAGFGRLRDHDVDAGLLQHDRFRDGRGGTENRAAGLLHNREVGDPESEAEDRDALLCDDLKLRVDEARRRRPKLARARQAELVPVALELSLHRLDRLRVDRPDVDRREEIDREGLARPRANGANRVAQRVRREHRAAERPQRAGVRDGGDELRRSESARHRRLHDRVTDAEQARDARCGPAHAACPFKALS